MAGQDWSTAAALIEELSTEAPSYAFFQAVRLLERALPGVPAVGGLGPAEVERVRFRARASLGFPRADIDTVEMERYRSEAERLALSVTFLGLYGVSSPLPTHYTEAVLGDDEDSRRRRDFMDVLNHRLVSLLYRAHGKYRRYWSPHESARQATARMFLAPLGAVDPDDLPADIDWPRLVPFAGLLNARGRCPSTVRAVLRRYFDGVAVELELMVAHEALIPPDQRNALGRYNATLGADLSLGERVANPAEGFRIHLGPLSFAEFREFLPDGRHFRPLRSLVRYLVRDGLSFAVVLWLRHEEIPTLCLGASEPRDGARPAGPGRLGRDAWLGKRPVPDHARSVTFRDTHPAHMEGR